MLELKAMNFLSNAVVIVEIGILMSGALFILPNLPSWQFENPMDSDTYCDLSLMLFSLTFLSGAWLFIVTGVLIFAVLYFSNRRVD